MGLCNFNISHEVMGNTEPGMCGGDCDRVGNRSGNRLTALGKRKRLAELTDPFVKEMKSAKKLQLVAQITALFGKFQASREGFANVFAVVLGEHHRQAQCGL